MVVVVVLVGAGRVVVVVVAATREACSTVPFGVGETVGVGDTGAPGTSEGTSVRGQPLKPPPRPLAKPFERPAAAAVTAAEERSSEDCVPNTLRLPASEGRDDAVVQATAAVELATESNVHIRDTRNRPLRTAM